MNDDSFTTLAAVSSWSALAAASRSILSEERRSIVGFLRGLVMALFVGIMAGLLVQDTSLTTSLKNAVVGIASFVADDILLIIIAISASIRKDPKEAVLNLIEYIFRGGVKRKNDSE